MVLVGITRVGKHVGRWWATMNITTDFGRGYRESCIGQMMDGKSFCDFLFEIAANESFKF